MGDLSSVATYKGYFYVYYNYLYVKNLFIVYVSNQIVLNFMFII